MNNKIKKTMRTVRGICIRVVLLKMA